MSSPKIQIHRAVSFAPPTNVKKGAWVHDFSTSHNPDKPFTSGLYIKDNEAEDATFTDWPNAEWKYIIEGEWHLEQDGEHFVGRAGDVVFIPKGADYTSCKNPFKAFFVANRAGVEHVDYKSKL